MGTCAYQLASTDNYDVTPGSRFRLIAENEFRNGNTRVSYLKAAVFDFYDVRRDANVTIKMNREGGGNGNAYVS